LMFEEVTVCSQILGYLKETDLIVIKNWFSFLIKSDL
jgi:hypothetical protein